MQGLLHDPRDDTLREERSNVELVKKRLATAQACIVSSFAADSMWRFHPSLAGPRLPRTLTGGSRCCLWWPTRAPARGP
jgi:hypothetical protein